MLSEDQLKNLLRHHEAIIVEEVKAIRKRLDHIERAAADGEGDVMLAIETNGLNHFIAQRALLLSYREPDRDKK